MPLNDLKTSRNWVDLIGFHQDPSDILPVKSYHHFEAYDLENCSFKTSDSSSLQRFKVPVCGTDYGDTLKFAPLS